MDKLSYFQKVLNGIHKSPSFFKLKRSDRFDNLLFQVIINRLPDLPRADEHPMVFRVNPAGFGKMITLGGLYSRMFYNVDPF